MILFPFRLVQVFGILFSKALGPDVNEADPGSSIRLFSAAFTGELLRRAIFAGQKLINGPIAAGTFVLTRINSGQACDFVRPVATFNCCCV